MPVSVAIRKAAILVSCLERGQADALLESMPEEQSRQVRQAMVELEEIDADERDEVIQEFVHRGGKRPASSTKRDDQGVELAGGLADQIAQSHRGVESASIEASKQLFHNRLPFDFLHQADGERLAVFLRDERPQTVALVLSYLPTEQSARVAALLPQPFQSEVLRKLSDLDEAAPEILFEVEHALRGRIERDDRSRARRSAGLEIVSRILDAAESKFADEWRVAVNEEVKLQANEETADVPPRTLTWPEFERWEPQRAVAAVLATPPETSVLALAGATPGFFQRLLTAMHPADAEFYRRATSQLSTTRLSDIDAAQRQLAAQAGEQSLTIPFPSAPALARAA